MIDELTPTAATRLPDGKTLVAAESQSNELLVGRLLGDGTIDPAFGFRRIDVGDTPQQAARILIDSAGRIVVGGRSDNDGFLLRLTATGELDTTFSGDGLVLYSDPSDFVSFDDIALDTDDAIYAYAHDQHTVHRYTAAGGLDPAFGGGDGISVPTPNLAEPRLLLDGNRRIVLAPRTAAPTTGRRGTRASAAPRRARSTPPSTAPASCCSPVRRRRARSSTSPSTPRTGRCSWASTPRPATPTTR